MAGAFFCVMACTPKATAQAAIGTILLSMGLKCGHIVLTVAVVLIMLTAPFGAIRWISHIRSCCVSACMKKSDFRGTNEKADRKYHTIN